MALSGFFFPVTEWHSFFWLFPLAFLLLIFNRKELFFSFKKMSSLKLVLLDWPEHHEVQGDPQMQTNNPRHQDMLVAIQQRSSLCRIGPGWRSPSWMWACSLSLPQRRLNGTLCCPRQSTISRLKELILPFCSALVRLPHEEGCLFFHRPLLIVPFFCCCLPDSSVCFFYWRYTKERGRGRGVKICI